MANTNKVEITAEEYRQFLENQKQGSILSGLAKSKTNWVMLAVGLVLSFLSRKYGYEFSAEDAALICTITMYVVAIVMRIITKSPLNVKGPLFKRRIDNVKESVLSAVLSTEFQNYFDRIVADKVYQNLKALKQGQTVKPPEPPNIRG